MANIRGKRLTTILVLAFSFSLFEAEGHRGLATPPASNNAVYDVTDFGAKGDGKPVYRNGDSMNGIGLMKAWEKACNYSTGPSKLVIPKGNFVVAPVIFAGPCKSRVTIELQGCLIADPDVSQFPNHEFLVFQNVDGATFTGFGTIDASNQVPKSSDTYKNDVDVFDLMPSIKLIKVKNMVVEGITSVNPASYHVFIVESEKINIHNVNFNSKSEASNTKSKGIYISASSLVSVSNSNIKTRDDCVTIAPGSTSVSLTGLTCAAGQGISIGSKPFTAELDIKGVIVKDCVFKGSEFAARIIPRLEVRASLVADIQLEGLVMDGVKNPIVIDQLHLKLDVAMKQSIQAKIANVQINNIKGTTTTRNPFSFLCSQSSPCESIQVGDIDLNFIGSALPRIVDTGLGVAGKVLTGKGLSSLVNCENAEVLFNGKNDGLSCGLLQ